jgi:glycosyltransferase involved in cell wall biosynthesis
MNVDVIIPCFNVEDFIEECLDSVKSQGKCVRKVFCVDNNSTDNTVNTINNWSQQNPDVELLLLHEKKLGAPSARNKPLSR